MWFKCPKCGEQIEKGQVPELKGFVSQGTAIAYELITGIAGMLLGFGISALIIILT